MQTDYVAVYNARLQCRNEKASNFKGVVDHALEVWVISDSLQGNLGTNHCPMHSPPVFYKSLICR